MAKNNDGKSGVVIERVCDRKINDVACRKLFQLDGNVADGGWGDDL